jgi:Tol biopolymer transport system component
VTADGRSDGEPVRLTSGVSAHGIAVARDGRLLLYSSYAPNANIWSIGIPDQETLSVSEAEQVTFGNEKIEKLAVSPDGQWLAYDSDVNGPADIWKMPLPGGRPEQLTHGPFHKFVNDWSPDGREILYHSIQKGTQRDLFVVSADGTHTERVTASPGEEQHAGWSPDGNSIVFDWARPDSRASNAAIVTRARRGAAWSEPRQLTKGGSGDPKWSPDGRLIAFCVGGQLRVIAPDGTGERVIVRAGSGQYSEPEYAIWSRDGGTLYYKSYDRDGRSSIWGVPLAGGPPRLLVRFDVPSRRSLRREFATDGRRFYFTIARDEGDIWAIQLLKAAN